MTHRKALVVDDSKSARFALRRFLEGREFDVDTAESADEAYRYLEDHAPEVIFLDHTMPGTDGFDVLREIKHDPRTQMIPVVICSSNEGKEFARKASDRGAIGVLPKPPTSEDLERVLSGLQSFAEELRQDEEDDSNVAPLRSLEASESAEDVIEQAVMRAVQGAIPATPVSEADSLDERLDAIGQQIEKRIRHAGESLAEQIGELQAQMDQMRAREEPTLSEAEAQALAREEAETVRESLQNQLDALKEHLQEQLEALRDSVESLNHQSQDEALAALGARIDAMEQDRATHEAELLQAARASAATEAATVASRTVMNAASKIADRLADSILKALGRQ